MKFSLTVLPLAGAKDLYRFIILTVSFPLTSMIVRFESIPSNSRLLSYLAVFLTKMAVLEIIELFLISFKRKYFYLGMLLTLYLQCFNVLYCTLMYSTILSGSFLCNTKFFVTLFILCEIKTLWYNHNAFLFFQFATFFVSVFLYYTQYLLSKIQDRFRSLIHTLHVQHSIQRDNV